MCHSVGVRRTSPSAVVTRLAARSTVKSSVSMTASFAGGVGRARTARQLGLLPGPRMQQGQVFELATRRSDGNPLWAYRFRAGGRDSRRVQRGGFRAEADARASLERALEKLRREIGVGRRPTLAEFVDEYLAQHGGLAGDAQSLAACRECPRVTGRALDDVPVSYPRHVVCLRNRRRLCCRRIVEIDIVADPERLRELDLTVLNH
jgi:hypothetical protein